jgi:hypothetical protein
MQVLVDALVTMNPKSMDGMVAILKIVNVKDAGKNNLTVLITWCGTL